MMTWRDQVAMHVLCVLIPQKGNDADEYEELACAYAEDLAKAACKRWGHRMPDGVHVIGPPGKCIRCGNNPAKERKP